MFPLEQPLGLDPMLFSLAPQDPEEPFIPTAHYASSLVGCLREHYFRWTGAPITNPSTLIQRQKMEAGDDDAITFRRRLSENAKYHGLAILDERAEIPIIGHVPGLIYPIRGRADVILDVLYAGRKERWLVEFKSVAGRGAKKLVGYHAKDGGWVEGDLNEYPAYLAQVWAYAKFFNEELDHIYLIAWDRESRLHQTYEFRVQNGFLWWSPVPRVFPSPNDPLRPRWKRAPFTWDEIIARLRILEEHVSKREPPPRFDPLTGKAYAAEIKNGRIFKVEDDEKTIGWKCAGYCEYADLCWLGKGVVDGDLGDPLPSVGG
jgi:hypothetical protein